MTTVCICVRIPIWQLASIVSAIEEYDEKATHWKPHAPSIPVIRNHGMKSPGLADADKLDLVFKSYNAQQRTTNQFLGSNVSKSNSNNRRSGSFTNQIKDLPTIHLADAVEFSQKISQVSDEFSMFLF